MPGEDLCDSPIAAEQEVPWLKSFEVVGEISVLSRQGLKSYLGWNFGDSPAAKQRLLRWIPRLQRGCNAACHDGPFIIRCCTQKSRFRLAKNVQKIDESNESIPQVICICHRLSDYLWWLRPFKNIPRLVRSTWLGAVYIFQACLRPDPREGERDWKKMGVLQLDR